MNHVTSTRRLGLCKELMSHLSHSLLPLPHRQTDTPSVRSRQEREGRLWRGLDSYVELVTKIFCKEGKNATEIKSVFLKGLDITMCSY